VAAGVAVIAIGLAAGATAGLSLARRTPDGHHVARNLALAPTPTPTAAGTGTALQEIAGQDLPEIVTVVAVGTASEELGTGWPVDSRGDFITNDHVVSQGLSFHVVTSSGAEYPARVVNSDPQLDLAEVQAEGLTESPLPLDTASASMGQAVVVLASQGATGHPPVTVSLVDGLNQRATVGDAEPGQLTNYIDLIRIPAHIFPGNSGGPVLTAQGQVVGIMTLAAKFGVGAFAIPLLEVLPVIRQWTAG
jgi:S1-C subfamily serine protease